MVYHPGMPIYLDDQPMEAAGPTLAAVLEQASEQLAPGGRIVVEVAIDDEQLAGERLDERLGDTIGDATVRLTSSTPAQIACEALIGVREHLAESRVLQAEAADLLQRDQQREGLDKVTLSINAWIYTQQAVLQSARLLNIDLDSFEVNGQELNDSVNDLVAQLTELRELITRGDMVGLADALAYEWPEITDRWDGLLGALLDVAKQ